jgi:hypothetical protein
MGSSSLDEAPGDFARVKFLLEDVISMMILIHEC